jgi:hypothetical protein
MSYPKNDRCRCRDWRSCRWCQAEAERQADAKLKAEISKAMAPRELVRAVA